MTWGVARDPGAELSRGVLDFLQHSDGPTGEVARWLRVRPGGGELGRPLGSSGSFAGRRRTGLERGREEGQPP